MSSSRRRIARNILWLFLGNFALKNIGLIAQITLARILTVRGFGILAYAQALLQIPTLLADAGLSALGTREVARLQPPGSRPSAALRARVVDLFRLRLALGLTASALCVLLAARLPIPWEQKGVLLGVCLWLIPQALSIDWVFRGMERMQLVGASTLAHQLLFLLGIFLWIRSPRDLIAVPLVRLASSMAATLLFLWILNRALRPAARQERAAAAVPWRGSLSQSLPMAASSFVSTVRPDFLVLGLFWSAEAVGMYEASHRFAYLAMSFVVILGEALTPTFSRLDPGDPDRFLRVFRPHAWALRLTSIAALCAAWRFPAFIMQTLYGSGYRPGADVLQWVSLTILSGSLSLIVLQPMLYLGQQRRCLGMSSAGLAVNLGLSLLLIPGLGYRGAAAAAVLAHLAIYALGLFSLRRTRLLPGSALWREGMETGLTVLAGALIALG